MRSRVFRGIDVEDAGGQPVLLIPGFLAGDDSLGLMTQWLRRTGHHTRKAGIRGQSRGGNLAKVLAVRNPHLVSGIVTLGSPQLDPFDVHPIVRMHVYAVGTLGTLGMRGFFKHRCKTGKCCESFWKDLAGPMPKGTGYLSVYSKSDGVVRWRACLDPEAEHLEIKASHVGMAVAPRAYRAIAGALAEFRAADRGPGTRKRRSVPVVAPALKRAA